MLTYLPAISDDNFLLGTVVPALRDILCAVCKTTGKKESGARLTDSVNDIHTLQNLAKYNLSTM